VKKATARKATETWMPSQYDLRAGISSPASV
jgi:hypothetical protein